MELKHLVEQFVYRIEPKPEGGFIARATDPNVPPLEAPTREELQRMVQARVVAALGEKFPGLKLPSLENKQVNFEMHVDRKPGGGFAVHSEEQTAPGATPANHEKLDHFAEELLNFVDKNFPQLSQSIAAQAGTQDIKVFVDRSTGGTSKTSGFSGLLAPTQPGKDVTIESVQAESTVSAAFKNGAISNAPITPEASGKIFRFLLAVAVLIGLMYFFAHRG